jgi:hypothetical protein
MKREISFASTMALLLALAPATFAQNIQSQPSPALPLDTLGPQLIAWSQVQKPQPLRQTDSSSDRSKPEHQQQPSQPANRTNEQKPGTQPISPSNQDPARSK